MRNRVRSARSPFGAPLLLASLLCFILAGPPDARAAQPGDVGLFFDRDGHQTSGEFEAGIPFEIYAIAFDLQDGVLGYDLGLFSSAVPITYFIVDVQLGPPGAVNLQSGRNWNVELAGCISGDGPVLLGTVRMISMTDLSDMSFCVRAPTPSRFDPPDMGWMSCRFAGDRRAFGFAVRDPSGHLADGCSVGNPSGATPVPGRRQSFGTLKATHR